MNDNDFELKMKFLSIDLQDEFRKTEIKFFKKNKSRVDEHEKMQVCASVDSAIGYLAMKMRVLSMQMESEEVWKNIVGQLSNEFNDKMLRAIDKIID